MWVRDFALGLWNAFSWLLEGFRPLFNFLKTIVIWFIIISLIGGIVVFIICLIVSFIQSLDRRKHPPRGKFFKEHPLDTIVLIHKYSFLEPCNDYHNRREFKKHYEPCGFEIRYEAKRTTTKWILESDEAKKQNNERVVEIEKELVKKLAGDSPCLFDRFGHVLRYGDEKQTFDCYENKGCTFCLDGKSNIKEWLENQDKITNFEGYTVAVRGIDGSTIDMLLSMKGEKNFEISSLIVPFADEEEISEMSLPKLMRFREKENHKFKISNENESGPMCFFEYSDMRGYTKEDITEAVRLLAESRGYKFKTEEKKFKPIYELLVDKRNGRFKGKKWVSRKEEDKYGLFADRNCRYTRKR